MAFLIFLASCRFSHFSTNFQLVPVQLLQWLSYSFKIFSERLFTFNFLESHRRHQNEQ